MTGKLRFISSVVLVTYVLSVALTPARAAAAPAVGRVSFEDPAALLDPLAGLTEPSPGAPDPLAPAVGQLRAARPDAITALNLAGQLASGAAGLQPPAPPSPDRVDTPAPPESAYDPVDAVDPATGQLSITEMDLSVPGVGRNLDALRRYDPARQDGPLGPGWQLGEDNLLKMYAGFDITELRGDGGRSAFTFHPANPNSYLWSYDGDSYIYYNLDEGSYTPASGMNTSALQRLSATEYVVTDKDQTRRYYAGYYAAWRSGQPATAGKITRSVDRNGNETTYLYDGQGHLTQVAGPGGRTLTLTWENGRVTAISDPAGNTVRYDYDASRSLVKVTAPDGSLTRFSYDAQHRLTERVSPLGARTRYEYAADGKVARILVAESEAATPVTVASYDYDTVHKVTRRTNALGRTWTYTYVYIGSKG